MAFSDEPSKKSDDQAGEREKPVAKAGNGPSEKAAGSGSSVKSQKPGAARPGAGKQAARPAGRGAAKEGRTATAHARYVRMAPRKLRLVLDSIRGKNVREAQGILQFCGKRAAGPLSKVLKSAVANAENNHSMDVGSLVIERGFVDQGPVTKGWIPRARGRASAIHKFTSHITIVVKEREEV